MFETQLEGSMEPSPLTKKILSSWKAVTLALITIAAAGALGFVLHYYFYSGSESLGGYAALFVISAIIFFSFLFFLAIAINNKWALGASALAVSIAAVYPFYVQVGMSIAIAGGVFFLFILLAVLEGNREVKKSLSIRFIKILSLVTSRALLGFAILLAVVFFNVSMTKPLDGNNLLFPRSLFDAASPLFSKVASPLFGGTVDLSMTLEQVAGQQVDSAVANSGNRLLERSMTPQLRQEFIDKAVAQLQTSFQSFMGVPIQANEVLATAVYDGLLHKFNTLDEPTRSSVSMFLSVIFVLAVGALSFIIRLVLIPIAFLFYELFLFTKFFTVSFKNESKEVITLT